MPQSTAATHLPVQYEGRKDLLGQARVRLELAADRLNLSAGLRDRLFAPHRVVSTYSPVRMNDGEVRVFPGYRVEHSNVLGPYYGGVRFHEEVDLDAITALALLATLQCALVGIPFGGAKGGVTVDPHRLAEDELERLTRRFTSDMVAVFDPKKDIPSPDVNTSEREMAWMMDTVSINRGYAVPGSVAGKPLSIGGTQGNRQAIGRGVYLVIEEYFKQKGQALHGKTVALEGFGKLGQSAAELLYKAGARVVAISDATGGRHSAEGLDVNALLGHVQAEGTVASHTEGQPISQAELLLLDVDLLVLASLSCQLTKSNAELVKAGLVCEGANMPITPEADKILERRGIPVIPELVANAGGLIVGYFEWVQDNNQLFWTEEEVLDRLRAVQLRAYRKVAKVAERDGLTLRLAAHLEAVGTLVEALSLRGLYP